MNELTRFLTISDLSGVRIDPAKLEAARGELTRSQVGKACGVTRRAIWQIERGHNLPSAELLAKLCTLYNKDVRELLVDSEPAAA